MSIAPTIIITPSAQEHFVKLLAEEESGTSLRIFIDHPGSPTSEVGVSFCPPGDEIASDLTQEFGQFRLFIDKNSSAFLDEARIDFKTDEMGGQLAIKAPNLRGRVPGDDASLKDKVDYILAVEINPNLAHHGGHVELVDITPENDIVLKFGGGCHGCGMADVTLKNGIERTLKTQLPEIREVVDSTNHATGTNPYFEQK